MFVPRYALFPSGWAPPVKFGSTYIVFIMQLTYATVFGNCILAYRSNAILIFKGKCSIKTDIMFLKRTSCFLSTIFLKIDIKTPHVFYLSSFQIYCEKMRWSDDLLSPSLVRTLCLVYYS